MNQLINPFRYIAGTKALVLGIIFIISSALLLYSDGMIQDSYIHLGFANVSFWQVLLVQFAWWLIPAILLYAGGLLLSSSHIRLIDVLGTTAFSQLLLIPMIAPMLLPVVKDSLLVVMETILQGQTLASTNMLAIMLYSMWSMLLLVLFFIWNYNAFSTSCNVKGWKAVTFYIVVQVVITIAGSMF